MVIRVGRGEQVEGDAETLPIVQKFSLILAVHILWSHATLVGGNRHRRPVCVTS